MSIKKQKQKQMVMLAAFFIFLIAVVTFLLFTARKGSNTKPVVKNTKVEFEEVGKQELKQWYSESVKQLKEVNSRLQNVSRSIDEISREVQKQKEEVGELKKKVLELDKRKSIPAYHGRSASKAVRTKAKKPPLPPPPPPPPTKTTAKKGQANRKGQPVGLTQISFQQELENRIKVKEEKKYEALRKFYIPSGTFVNSIVLSGIDAPTGMGAKKDTIPVLLTLADDSILPNDWKADLKDCRIIGEAYGDLSSERVYIRTDYMSCVDNGGNVYDFQLNGYVAGEDGKAGVRGRVVSKQGSLIARAMLAGFFEGVGGLLQTTATQTTITGTGVVATVNPDEALRAGVFAGSAKSAEKLSQYYMNLLDQTFPVIEVGAGRKATVIVQKGRWIKMVGKTEDVEYKEVKTPKGVKDEKKK